MAENSQAIATRQSQSIESAGVFSSQRTQEQASLLYSSGFFETLKSPAQAMAIILAGEDLGLTPMQALTNLYVQRGKIGVSASFISRKIQESGKYKFKVVKCNLTGCHLELYNLRGELLGESIFGPEEAKRAELANSAMYKKYPINMYFSRAVANLYRWFCPEVLGASGVYTQEELTDGAITDTMQVDELSRLYQDTDYLWALLSPPDKNIADHLGCTLPEAEEEKVVKIYNFLLSKLEEGTEEQKAAYLDYKEKAIKD